MAEIEMVDKTKSDEINKNLSDFEKNIGDNEKEAIIIDDSGFQQEKKTYINLYICQLSVGIIVTYLYIIISILMNVINRVIFHTYKFRFNFTILFCQQTFCLITFIYLSNKSEKFRSQVGELSFFDFKKLYKNYFLFALVFILNNLAGFIGNQLITNTPMFLTLRKLVLVMIYFTDIFIGKKKLSCFTASCVFMVTFGSVLAGIEDFSSDYKGYIVVIIYNSLTVLYNKMTETFKKKTGIPNLKLLVYNSFLLCPTLFGLIFLSKENKALYIYMTGEQIFDGSYFGLFVYLFLSFAFCIALMLSFFISNEKNSSLFTAMLSNSKDIAITALSYFWLKETKFTFCILGGLFISTVGALLISVKSMIDNMKKKEDKEDKEDKEKVEKKEYESIGVNDEDKNQN